MNTNMRQLIKSLNNGKNLDNDLPSYVRTLSNEYHSYALTQAMMQYYVMCEQHEDGYFKEKEVLETVRVIHEMMEELFVKENSLNKEACIQRIDAERTRIIRKMEVLTNYTDQLMIYEYILNRMEYKFEDEEQGMDEDDSMFVQQLLQYVLSVKDNYVVNEKIKEVIGQLPVRMARSKFYELVKNSISLYKGSEKDSLDGYLYMLRTSASLYKPECEGQYFESWGEFVAELRKVDFDSLEKEQFDKVFLALKEKAQDISDASEVFVTLQELINSLYAYLLVDMDTANAQSSTWEKEESICKEIIISIANKVKIEDNYGMTEEVMQKLELMEGIPEKIMTGIQHLMGSFQMAKESYHEKIHELQLEKAFSMLEKLEDLLSSSIFIEFKKKCTEEVTEKMAEEETVKLVEEFSELFHGSSIRFVRAVIASVLSRMPVFFAGVEEVSEYMQTSLEQCKDIAEKKACYELLRDMLEEDQ